MDASDAKALEDAGMAPEMRVFLQEEKQKAMLTEMVAKLTDICWDKCITGTPGGKFSSGEQACLANCAARFMESTVLILRSLHR